MTRNNNKIYYGIICIFLLAVFSASFSQDFPPDNAAVLYLRAFVLFENPSRELDNMLNEFRNGEIESNDQIRQYCQKSQPVIELVTTASQIPDCDWGQDLSKGLDLLMPELATIRRLAFLLLADSKVHLEDGDYKTSLERCLTIHRMGRHVGNNLVISNLVGVALNALADGHIKIVLSEMPADVETLEWLKNQMIDISSKRPSFISAIVNEAKISVQEIQKENIDEILKTPEVEEVLKSLSKEQIEKIRNGDETFFEESRKYYLDFIASVQAAFALSYEDAQREVTKLNDKITKEAQTNPAAILTATMSPSIAKLFTLEIRNNTDINAANAAIDIYIVKAKTGQLPDELPAGLPKDLYSRKDFKYEKTDDGFILRCQGKDLDRDEIREYEFKVKK